MAILKTSKKTEFEFNDKVRYIEIAEGKKISTKNYTRLLSYINARVDEYDVQRRELISRMEEVDRAIGGCKSREEQEQDEAERRETRKNNEGDALEKAKLNLTLDRLNDAMTSIVGILFPQHSFYRVTAEPADMQKAHALAKMLNEEASKFKHYSEITKIIMSALKYNICGGVVEWAELFGRSFENEVAGQSLNTDNGNVVFEGNKINAIDAYNTGWDMSVNVEDVARDAEYFWQVSRKSLHSLRKRLYTDDDIYGPKEFRNNLEDLVDDITEIKEAKYNDDEEFDLETDFAHFGNYAKSCRYHSREMFIYNGDNVGTSDPKTNGMDWLSWMGKGVGKNGTEAFGTAEVLEIFININPKDFGLGKKNGSSTWYFQIVNDVYIIYGAEIGKNGAPLPVFLSTISDNTSGVDKSLAEMVMPLQKIGEKLINAHFMSVLKKLGNGNTFVRKGLIDANQVASNVNGVHTVDTVDHDKPISHHVHQISETPNTENSFNDLNLIDEIARQMLPTASGKVMTDLDRATKHQSQTVKFENSRLMNHIATLLDSRAFVDMRAIMRDNELINRDEFDGGIDIAPKQPQEGETVDPNAQPERLTFSAEEMRSVKLTLSNGLLNIDRFAVMSALEAIINFAIQSGERNKFDMASLLNYYSDYAGVEMDLNAFVEQNPLNQLDPQIQQILAQAAQNGQLEQIVQAIVQQQQGAGAGQ